MFERITADPARMGGVPCIRGLRIPVATIVGMIADGMIADGMTTEEILDSYPDLQRDDIREALLALRPFVNPDQHAVAWLMLAGRE